MEEIEFRARRVDNNEWVCGCYVFDEYQSWIIEYGENTRHEVVSDTIEQYTGLKDEDNKRIYKKDITKLLRKITLFGKYIDGLKEILRIENAVVINIQNVRNAKIRKKILFLWNVFKDFPEEYYV